MDLSSDSSAQLRERIAFVGFQAGNEKEHSQQPPLSGRQQWSLSMNARGQSNARLTPDAEPESFAHPCTFVYAGRYLVVTVYKVEA